jgi:hypothetical protein
MAPAALRQATETAIRECHRTQAMIDDGDQASGYQPNIFNLSLGRTRFYYTIESIGVVVRGYIWEHGQDASEAWYVGCSYICEPEWYAARSANWLVMPLRPEKNNMGHRAKRALNKLLDFLSHPMHLAVPTKSFSVMQP